MSIVFELDDSDFENRPVANSREYFAFCVRYGIKPIEPIGLAMYLRFPKPPSGETFFNYLRSPQARTDVSAALCFLKPSLGQEVIEEFFQSCWPVDTSRLFGKVNGIQNLGRFDQFTLRVYGTALEEVIKPNSNALKFRAVCDRYGVDSTLLLRNCLKLHPLEEVNREEITRYLNSSGAIADMTLAFVSAIPDIKVRELEELFANSFPLAEKDLFLGDNPLLSGQLFSRYNNLLSTRRPHVHSWTKDAAIEAIAVELGKLGPDELQQYFPFGYFVSGTKSYGNFRASCSSEVALPMPQFLSSTSPYFQNIYELNVDIAAKLGIDYSPPLRQEMIDIAVNWLEAQGRTIQSFTNRDVLGLIQDGIVDRRLLIKGKGIFNGKQDFHEAVRNSDGTKRISNKPVLTDISRQDVVGALRLHFPTKIKGVHQEPPTSRELEGLSRVRAIPSLHRLIGAGDYFESIVDLRRAIGFPQFEVPVRFPHNKAPKPDPRVALGTIEKIVAKMYEVWPDHVGPFKKADFKEAQRVGILICESRIIGKGQWFQNEDAFAEYFPGNLERNTFRRSRKGEFPKKDKAKVADLAMEALTDRFLASGILVEDLTVWDVKRWSLDDSCPSVSEIEKFVAPWHGVKAVLGFLERGVEPQQAQGFDSLVGLSQ